MRQNQLVSLDDTQLVAFILEQRAGWRDRLSILLQRHHAALLGRCHAYLKNREDAEDAAQETELRVFRAIHRFRGESSFRTWLFAIADRQCHNLVHKRARQVMDMHLFALIEIHEHSLRSTTATDSDAMISTLLTQLPEQARDVLVLRFYKELSFDDMAVTLGLGLSATKMRLYRALEQLSAMLQKEQYAEY